MRPQLIDRIIAMPIAILLTLLAGSEAGLASNDLASDHDPRMGSAQVFTDAQPARIVFAGAQMAALNAAEEPFASLGLHFTDGPLAQIWQDVKVRVLVDMARLALCAAQERLARRPRAPFATSLPKRGAVTALPVLASSIARLIWQ